MWFKDLSPCTYFSTEIPMVAVGWLERERIFETGPIDRSVYLKIVELTKNAWQFAFCGGTHKCDLCQFDAGARGVNSLFIPHGDVLYASPELITHYINAHHYRPPEGFCEAVLACPPMRSLEYYRALRRAGGPNIAQYLKASTRPGVDR